MYDLTIIGGGPAGVAASVYSARKQLKTLQITSEFGGQSNVSETIFNWIGTKAISGADLAKNLKEHAKEYEGEFLKIVDGEKVVSVTKNEDGSFTSTTETGKKFESKNVLITTGSGRRKLDIKGADIFEHKGLTYCASCDGPMFSGQNVVVVGGGNAAFETAAQLLAYCTSVTLVNRSHHFRADEITIKRLKENPKLRIILGAEMLEVLGDKFVKGLKIRSKDTGEEETLEATGVFIEIGQIPNTDLVKGLVDLDQNGKIITDPMTGKTSVPGIWAAGDATNGLYHQNNIAAGDAVKALENIYLEIHTR
jgi:NADH-dependent peroxiredoxin subunit F